MAVKIEGGGGQRLYLYIVKIENLPPVLMPFLRRFCVFSFCEFCVRFTQTMVFVYLGVVVIQYPVDPLIFLVVQQYDMLY